MQIRQSDTKSPATRAAANRSEGTAVQCKHFKAEEKLIPDPFQTGPEKRNAGSGTLGEEGLQMGKGLLAQRKTETHPAPVNAGVIQGKFQILRIGITGPGNALPHYAFDVDNDTNVWILSNAAVTEDVPGVTKGNKKSSINEIIAANQANVANGKRADTKMSEGKALARYFQSGVFQVPRRESPGGNRNLVDYSFLRFAAIRSYDLWQKTRGNIWGWPDLASADTQVETIDSDKGGIRGKAAQAPPREAGSWLAEAGVYEWDWRDAKEDVKVNNKFKSPEGNIDENSRDKALETFSAQYTEAEADAREGVSGDIFKIYFPEPATRLSPDGIKLLVNSTFNDIKVTAGDQIGHKRESIGLIAGLVHLDMKTTNNESRSKAKLKFNKNFRVTTGLGERKDAYLNIFSEWLQKAQKGNGDFNHVDFRSLDTAQNFDQTYLNPETATNIQKWHNNTLIKLGGGKEEAFFSPE